MTNMRTGWILLPLFALGCDGRELTVFNVPPAGGAGTSTNVAASGSSNGGANVGGTGVPNVAGSTSGVGGSTGGSGGAFGTGASTGGYGGIAGSPFGNGIGGGGTPVPMPKPCKDESDCGGWMCDKDGCDATTGVCVPFPAFCPLDPQPVCGCDGVTYWNDCIRLQSAPHTDLAQREQCHASACTCEQASDCDVPYASCAHLMGPNETCGGHSMGACWVLPPMCGPSNDPKRWRECKPPDAGPPGPCVDTCQAVQSERPFALLHRGETCN